MKGFVGGIGSKYPGGSSLNLRPRTQRQRLLVIEIHDLFRVLRDECVAHTRLSKALNYLYGQEEAWRELLYEVDQLTEMNWNLLKVFSPHWLR